MKAGLIGYGYWGGGFVARNLARVFDLTVIVDPSPARQVEAAEAWGPWGIRVASEPWVAIEECDVVWIATPAVTHGDLVRRALAEGCHVLCEKPFVLDAIEAEALCVLSEEVDRVLMVGHLSLFTEAHRRFSVGMSFPPAIGDNPITVATTHRLTDRPSLSDHSVLWGLGPHDIASVVSVLGLPMSQVWRGNLHRAWGELVFDRAIVRVMLDWLARERSRGLQINNGPNLALLPDGKEPLLAEAEHFRALCSDREHDGRATARLEAQQVTACLAAAASDLSVVMA